MCSHEFSSDGPNFNCYDCNGNGLGRARTAEPDTFGIRFKKFNLPPKAKRGKPCKPPAQRPAEPNPHYERPERPGDPYYEYGPSGSIPDVAHWEHEPDTSTPLQLASSILRNPDALINFSSANPIVMDAIRKEAMRIMQEGLKTPRDQPPTMLIRRKQRSTSSGGIPKLVNDDQTSTIGSLESKMFAQCSRRPAA